MLTYQINDSRRLKKCLLKGERSLSADMGIDFALWKDDISDEKLEEIPRSSDTLFEKNLLFPSNFPWRILLRKARSRELR